MTTVHCDNKDCAYNEDQICNKKDIVLALALKTQKTLSCENYQLKDEV